MEEEEDYSYNDDDYDDDYDDDGGGWGGRKPVHPQGYYNRSSESLLKRVYTGLGVD